LAGYSTIQHDLGRAIPSAWRRLLKLVTAVSNLRAYHHEHEVIEHLDYKNVASLYKEAASA
jgi:hypothetical protein